MSRGFLDAGFDILLATDADSNAAKTYAANHPGIPFLIADAKKREELSGEIILSKIGLDRGQLDIVVGGPPCRGFSSGNRQSGGPDNEYNALVKEYARIVLEIQPHWFVLENVVGLYYMEEIRGEFENLLKGVYKIYSKIMNAADFAVPQERRRIIFVGNRDGIKFDFPEGAYAPKSKAKGLRKKPYVTVKEAIGDLPRLGTRHGKDEMCYRKKARTPYQELMRGNCEKVLNHVITKSGDDVIERYRCIPQGGNWSALPDEMIVKWRNTPIEQVKKSSHSNLYLRLDPNKPSPTIGNFRKSMFIHPTEHRGLSLREAARLQSFPDWYQFKGGISSAQQQIGNATPPLLARAIASQILQYMKSDAVHPSEPSNVHP
jgi:DNA (cytosine-5)-methyltransferase 1